LHITQSLSIKNRQRARRCDLPRFEKGAVPGPGRPRGLRNRSTQLLDELGAEGIEEVIRVVNQHALKGNMQAASLLLTRTWPNRRGRPVTLDLPSVETATGLVQAQAAVVAAMANAQITPDEAAAVASVLEIQRRAIETHNHEQRIRDLEADKAEPARSAAAV
jgi:hypothetical protein